MTRPEKDPNPRHNTTPLSAEQSEELAIQAAARWVASSSRERFLLSNALWAMKLWAGSYKPEATLLRRSVEISAHSSMDNMRAFQELYVDEANEYLHTQKGPVIVGEIMGLVDETHPAHNAPCVHCPEVLPGATAQIVGAKDPTDLTITLDRFRGSAANATVKIAEDPRDETVCVELTDMELHMLHAHYQEEDVSPVLSKMLQLAPYVPAGGLGNLEPPYFRSPGQQ
jgi:hypothetical protein